MTETQAVEFNHSIASFIEFRDAEEARRVAAIPRESITEHSNPDFHISVIEDGDDFDRQMAGAIVDGIRDARDRGERHVVILPVGPTAQYPVAARLINEQQLDLSHVDIFTMDEFVDDDGRTAPVEWSGSFRRSMWSRFLGNIDEQLRPPESQIHFPAGEDPTAHSQRIADLGGADVCYGGIGWCGHVGFWEPHLAREFGSLSDYLEAGSRIVDLHPITVMQQALHSFGSNWAAVPPRAVTIGPRDVMGAKRRSFWLNGDIPGGMSWQRFIGRLVAHGPVCMEVPGSMLQLGVTDYTFLSAVAANVEIAID